MPTYKNHAARMIGLIAYATVAPRMIAPGEEFVAHEDEVPESLLAGDNPEVRKVKDTPAGVSPVKPPPVVDQKRALAEDTARYQADALGEALRNSQADQAEAMKTAIAEGIKAGMAAVMSALPQQPSAEVSNASGSLSEQKAKAKAEAEAKAKTAAGATGAAGAATPSSPPADTK